MHLSEEDLILHFYGESPASSGRGEHAGRVARHLEECRTCAALFEEVAGTLALVPEPNVPPRSEDYGAEVWQTIRFKLPMQEAQRRVSWLPRLPWPRIALATAAALLLVAAFAAGRFWAAPSVTTKQVATTTAPASPSDAGDRVRLAAIADHLEQSERLLLDVLHAEASPATRGASRIVNVSRQQEWADTLIDANRIYRDSASLAGDEDIAALLDDLERSLLDIVHGPSTLTPAQLETTLVRLDAATLLFKVRVLADELHERELSDVTDTRVKS